MFLGYGIVVFLTSEKPKPHTPFYLPLSLSLDTPTREDSGDCTDFTGVVVWTWIQKEGLPGQRVSEKSRPVEKTEVERGGSGYTNITDIRLGHERNKPICIICPAGINSPLKVATNEVIHWMNVRGGSAVAEVAKGCGGCFLALSVYKHRCPYYISV